MYTMALKKSLKLCYRPEKALALNFSSSPPNNEKNNPKLDQAKLKLFELMSIYEEAIGLKEVKVAQQNVLEVSDSHFAIKIAYLFD